VHIRALDTDCPRGSWRSVHVCSVCVSCCSTLFIVSESAHSWCLYHTHLLVLIWFQLTFVAFSL
jgi:hypothetical protein